VPVFPVRNVAKFGVVADVDPYDIPTAWSLANNARFRNDTVTRGPVFRTSHVLANANPRFLVSFSPVSGLDQLFIGYKPGTLYN
jgi:hypothetical protein